MKSLLFLALLGAGIALGASEAVQQEDVSFQTRRLQQLLPPLPIDIPLPPFLTNSGGPLAGLFGGSGQSSSASTSLQTQPAAANSTSTSNSTCTATFAQVLESQPELFFLSSALSLSGFQSSLPSPSLGLTIFAPTNGAFLNLLNELNLGLLDLLSLQDKLPGLLLYSVVLGGFNGDTLLQDGSVSTILSAATGQSYPLNFSIDPLNNQRLLIKTVDPGNEARTLKAIKVCESYVYVIDNILLPTTNNTIAGVPPVNSTFLQQLIGIGNADASTSSASSASSGVGTVTDPSCHTTFLKAAQNTAGLDFLVQAIQRGNLASVLPAAGSGATVFAPNNAAFTNMLQTQNLTIMDALNLGDKLQSLLLYHFLPSAYNASQLVAEQTLDTDLGVSTGTPYNLTFGQTPAGQVQVAGNYPNNTANVLNSTNVCNSIVHIVDQVLLPTASLATVPAPGTGLTGTGQAAAPASASALFPGLLVGNKQTKASGKCQQAFLDAANKRNLTFLVQAIQAGNLTNALPNFATASTAFAPVNSAFYGIVTGQDFGLDKLATAGSRLKSVLLYHISPGGALTLNQLAAGGNLTTILGNDLHASYPLIASRNATNGAVVSGLSHNDTAHILGSFTVCNSTVYLVDALLLPAATLDAIPQINGSSAAPAAAPVAAPAAAPVAAPVAAKTGPVAAQSLPAARAAAAPAPAAAAAAAPAPANVTGLQSLAVRTAPGGAAPVLNGVAFGAGWYTNCPVSYQKGQQLGQATTNTVGAFALPVTGAANFSGGLLSIPANTPSCVDALTNLPPPFTVGALVPQGTAGQAPTPVVNALTTVAYYLKKNVDSAQLASILPLLGGKDFTAEDLDTLLGVAFGVANAGTSIPSTNYITGLQGGDANALKLEVLNAELLSSVAIGSQVLVALKPNGQQLTTDQAVQALYLSTLPVGVSFVTGGQGFSLTNPDVLSQTFNSAIASFGNSNSSASPASTTAAAGGRRLMQAAAAPSVSDPRILAVGATTAQLNQQLEAIPGQFSAGTLDGNAALDQIARVVKAAQGQVAPAVAQLLAAQPTLTVQAFNASYSGDALTNLVSGSQQLVG